MGDVQYNDNIHYTGAVSMYEPSVFTAGQAIKFFETLTDMEKAVISVRGDNPGITDAAISRLLSISRPRVNAINKHIKAKYKKIMG